MATTSAVTRLSAAAGAQIVSGNFAGQIRFRTGGGSPAFIFAHENTLRQFQSPLQGESPPVAAWPTDVFFGERKDLYFNGEAVIMLHQPNAHTDGDLFVHFRGSDVIATGDAYVNGSFPFLDRSRGGSIQGYLAGLNNLLDIMVPADKQEGGTIAIPGHGRLADEADVLEYRDMNTIVPGSRSGLDRRRDDGRPDRCGTAGARLRRSLRVSRGHGEIPPEHARQLERQLAP